jgi:hypothetical protein
MANIKKFNQFFASDEISNFVVESLLSLQEGKDNHVSAKAEEYKGIFQKIKDDLNLNSRLIPTFGFGIGGFYPIVESIMKMEGFQVTKRSVVLLTLAAISIIIIGDGKKKDGTKRDERDKLIEDVNVKVLQELNQTVSPNSSTGDSPILKRAISIIKDFYNSFWSKIFKGELKKQLENSRSKVKSIWNEVRGAFGSAIGGLVDMLAYTSMMMPVMNVVDNTIENFPNIFSVAKILPENLLAFASGIGIVISKHGVAKLISKFGNIEDEKQIADEIETPIIQKIANFGDHSHDDSAPMIKEEP